MDKQTNFSFSILQVFVLYFYFFLTIIKLCSVKCNHYSQYRDHWSSSTADISHILYWNFILHSRCIASALSSPSSWGNCTSLSLTLQPPSSTTGLPSIYLRYQRSATFLLPPPPTISISITILLQNISITNHQLLPPEYTFHYPRFCLPIFVRPFLCQLSHSYFFDKYPCILHFLPESSLQRIRQWKWYQQWWPGMEVSL